MTDAFWNGEPCAAERGTGVMTDSPEFPQFWGKVAGLVGERVPVVKVTYGLQTFYIYNEGDQGWLKVTVGKGSPQYGHRGLGVEGYAPEVTAPSPGN